MDNLEAMDKFLGKYNFPKLNQEEIDNRLITSMEIEAVIRNLPANKSPGPDGTLWRFLKKLEIELHMTQQSHCWANTWRKPELKEPHVPQCSSQHCL